MTQFLQFRPHRRRRENDVEGGGTRFSSSDERRKSGAKGGAGRGGGGEGEGEVIGFNAHGAPFDKMANICTITVVIESLAPRRADL